MNTPVCAGVLKGADFTQPTLPVLYYTRVQRRRDAMGAWCVECGKSFSPVTDLYWHWSKSAVNHQRGTGHTVLNVTWEVRHEAADSWEVRTP